MAQTLITGASDGLGVEFARITAKEKRDVILTARSKEKLEVLTDELRATGVQAIVIAADLSDMNAVERLWQERPTGVVSTYS